MSKQWKRHVWIHWYSESNSFNIETTDTEQFLEMGQKVVIVRKDSTITLGCTQRDPCSITIKGEQWINDF